MHNVLGRGEKKRNFSEMYLKSKVSESTRVKQWTLRMRFMMETVPSLKMSLKFKLDSLFQQTTSWKIFSSVHGFCIAIFLFQSFQSSLIDNENYPV